MVNIVIPFEGERLIPLALAVAASGVRDLIAGVVQAEILADTEGVGQSVSRASRPID